MDRWLRGQVLRKVPRGLHHDHLHAGGGSHAPHTKQRDNDRGNESSALLRFGPARVLKLHLQSVVEALSVAHDSIPKKFGAAGSRVGVFCRLLFRI